MTCNERYSPAIRSAVFNRSHEQSLQGAIGDGFYGVDVKETDRGFIVMEVNDNPNLEHGIEDQVGKDEVWTKVLKWFVERFEQ